MENEQHLKDIDAHLGLEAPDLPLSLHFEKKRQEQHLSEREDVLDMRQKMYRFLKYLLIAQSIAIFGLIVLQGFGWWDFYLDKYIFYILIAGSLIQTYFLIRVVCKFLFSRL